MCDVRYDMNLMIGTLLYLWPNGRVNITQTGGQIMKAMRSKTNLNPDQFKTPRQSSYDTENNTVLQYNGISKIRMLNAGK